MSVILKLVCDYCPVALIMVLQAIFVLPKSFVGWRYFWRSVDVDELAFEAFVHIWVAIIPFRETEAAKRLALAESWEHDSGQRHRAWMVKCVPGGRIEAWHTLPAKLAWEQINMRVENRVDFVLAKSCHDRFNLVKVFLVVYAGRRLKRFPENSKADDIGSPVFQVLNVLVSQT